MNRSDWQKAVDEGVYEAAKDRAKNMANNETGEGGDLADQQFEATVNELQDAHERMSASIAKLFPIT
jgi:hypothetical protein